MCKDQVRNRSKNLAATMPEKLAEMQAVLDKRITDGRSTPGPPQKTDVEVTRHPRAAKAKAKEAPKVETK